MPNATTAPDGTNIADTLTAIVTGSRLSQAMTIASGRGIAFVVFVKTAVSSTTLLELADGSNTIQVRFNLATGASIPRR